MKLFFVSLLVSLALLSTASADEWIDVVYLKNGGVVRGVIVEQVPGKSIKIETRDGNVLIFKMEEVDKLVRERSKAEPAPRPPPTPPKPPPTPPPTPPTPPPPVEPRGRRWGFGATLSSGVGYLQAVNNSVIGTVVNTIQDVTFVPLDLTAGLLLSYGEQGPEHLFGLGFRQIFSSQNGASTSNLDIFARYRFRLGIFSTGAGVGLDTGGGGTVFAFTGHAGFEFHFTRYVGMVIDVLSLTTYIGSAKTLILNLMLGPTMRLMF
jgi:hypothetical protein